MRNKGQNGISLLSGLRDLGSERDSGVFGALDRDLREFVMNPRPSYEQSRHGKLGGPPGQSSDFQVAQKGSTLC